MPSFGIAKGGLFIRMSDWEYVLRREHYEQNANKRFVQVNKSTRREDEKGSANLQ